MNPAYLKHHKLLLRLKLRHSLSRIQTACRKRKSRIIIGKLTRNPVFKKARNVLTYVALPDEVETREFILKALKSGKNVFVPAVERARKRIRIYRIESLRRDLRKGAYGIDEPLKKKARLGDPKCLDLILVPGLGFDRMGRRLGRGAGYYDRFLKRASGVVKVGIAFKEQVVKKIPTAKHDVRLDDVITD
ncbi:MAG: 5-formyltetrahydrofolate cyclo-ligase [Candidatus Omnitrophica bacterium]|nr:5-formyltetrahydrofolate cyclo-ligase [Candidatus Omnitrophota bacterium]MDD5672015.1 5-formyltetrahydrofolate cyclo-ligase [Candidatus Omnitrophota bacterium]